MVCMSKITLILTGDLDSVADLEILGRGILCALRAKNLKPHPLFTWPRPSLRRCEAFLCFCRAATIFDHKSR